MTWVYMISEVSFLLNYPLNSQNAWPDDITPRLYVTFSETIWPQYSDNTMQRITEVPLLRYCSFFPGSVSAVCSVSFTHHNSIRGNGRENILHMLYKHQREKSGTGPFPQTYDFCLREMKRWCNIKTLLGRALANIVGNLALCANAELVVERL